MPDISNLTVAQLEELAKLVSARLESLNPTGSYGPLRQAALALGGVGQTGTAGGPGANGQS